MQVIRSIRSSVIHGVCLAMLSASIVAQAKTPVDFSGAPVAQSGKVTSAATEQKPAAKPAKHARTHAASAATTVVNINSADVEVLSHVKGIGKKKAEAIVAFRQSNGAFKSVDELSNVKGIGTKTIERLRTQLTI